MPVKISSLQSDDPRVISLDEFNFGRENFQLHYSKAPGPDATEFAGQDFQVSWDSFSGVITDFCTINNIDEQDVALRFVHCFDGTSNSLFLRMQICSLGTPYVNPDGLTEYPLVTTPCAWYSLKNGSVAQTNDDTLKGAAYFDAMYYNLVEGQDEYEQLSTATDKYVENITYPWYNEIYQMYVDNGEPTGADIHFGACSYTDMQTDPNVLWPHGNVMYLSTPTHTYLDNGDSMTLFSNKGCDDGTPCPPSCGVYIDPVPPPTQ